MLFDTDECELTHNITYANYCYLMPTAGKNKASRVQNLLIGIVVGSPPPNISRDGRIEKDYGSGLRACTHGRSVHSS